MVAMLMAICVACVRNRLAVYVLISRAVFSVTVTSLSVLLQTSLVGCCFRMLDYVTSCHFIMFLFL